MGLLHCDQGFPSIMTKKTSSFEWQPKSGTPIHLWGWGGGAFGLVVIFVTWVMTKN
jgi:uncharacterized membrane protein YdcZ (DUF606 family)